MEQAFEIQLFDIKSSKKAKSALCDQLIREIIGRRQVFQGRFEQKDAIVKLFQSKFHKRRHFLREFHGFNKLTARNLATAEVLAAGQDGLGQYILVLEKIENATDLLSYIQNPENDSQVATALNQLFELLGKMHQAGVTQQDLHLGNFLWDGRVIYALDPAEMRFSSKPISHEKSIQQLAVLFANLHLSFWENRRTLLETYFQAKNKSLDEQTLKRIESASQKQRQRAINRFLRKTLRTSKHYIKTTFKNYIGVFDRPLFENQNTQQFMKQLDDLMRLGQILKNGNTCFVSKIQIDNIPIVAKRYNYKGFGHAFRHTLKRSRARHCWLFGNRLKMLQIPSAEPVAYIEQRKYGIIRQSYILNKFIEGPQLYDIVNHDKYKDLNKEGIIAQVDQLLNELIRSNLTHGDMKPNNILICAGNPVLIDLDSMKRHWLKSTLNFYSQKMLTQFRNRLYVTKY